MEKTLTEGTRRATPALVGSRRVILITGLALAALAVLFHLLTGQKFLTLNNVSNMLVAAAVPSFTAWALSFIFACDIVDFSVGAVILLAATVTGTVGNEAGVLPMIACSIAVGVFLFVLNFQIYLTTKIPSWIAAMGMTMIYESITLIYSDSRLQEGLQVVTLNNEQRMLGLAPWIFIVFAIGLALAWLLYNRTTIGLNIRATGRNAEVARMMGIPIRRTLVLGGAIAGFFVGCAGFLTECYAGRVIGVTGLASIATVFQPIAAVLLAQAMRRHIDYMAAIPLATLFITAIFNLMTLLGIQSGTWQQVTLGLTVILFGIVARRGTKGVVK